MKEEAHEYMKYFVRIFGKPIQTDKETFEFISGNTTAQNIIGSINELYEQEKENIERMNDSKIN